RLQDTSDFLNSPEQTSMPQQLQQILDAWITDYQSGGIEKFIESAKKPSHVIPNATLFDEDIHNITKLGSFWKEQQESAVGDVDFARDQALRINHIVNQMRELVRVASIKKNTACHPVIRENIQTMSDYCNKHGITFKESFEAKEDTALLDRDELIQIL